MKQFQPFRKNWANCCHILLSSQKKRRSRLSGRCGWKVVQSFHTQLPLSSERFSCWSKRFEPFFRHVSQMTDCLLHSGSQRLFLAGLSCLTVITEGVERFTPSCGQFSAVLTRVKRRPSSALWLVSSAVNHWYHPITPLYVTRFLWCVAFQRLKVVVVRLVPTSFDFTSNCNKNSLWPQWTQWNQQVVY